VADRPLERRLPNPNHGCGCPPCGVGIRGTVGPPEARIDPTPLDSWWLVDSVWEAVRTVGGFFASWWLVDWGRGGDSGSWRLF
jgi:hypothetical protein